MTNPHLCKVLSGPSGKLDGMDSGCRLRFDVFGPIQGLFPYCQANVWYTYGI